MSWREFTSITYITWVLEKYFFKHFGDGAGTMKKSHPWRFQLTSPERNFSTLTCSSGARTCDIGHLNGGNPRRSSKYRIRRYGTCLAKHNKESTTQRQGRRLCT